MIREADKDRQVEVLKLTNTIDCLNCFHAPAIIFDACMMYIIENIIEGLSDYDEFLEVFKRNYELNYEYIKGEKPCTKKSCKKQPKLSKKTQSTTQKKQSTLKASTKKKNSSKEKKPKALPKT